MKKEKIYVSYMNVNIKYIIYNCKYNLLSKYNFIS